MIYLYHVVIMNQIDTLLQNIQETYQGKELEGVDLDEVLFNTIDAILAFHDYKINGMTITKDDITNYHIYNIQKFGISKEYAIRRFQSFLDSDQVDKITPVI